MPELPEVETIKRGLQSYLVGHTIRDVEIRLVKQIIGDPKNIIGAKVIAVRRFGKGLIIDLGSEYSLAVHVKMTGQLIYREQGNEIKESKVGKLPNQYTHVIFQLDRGATLYYNDLRQFGWIKIVQTAEVLDLPFFKSLGKEPLKDLSLQDFQQVLRVTKAPIKQVIMDQTKIAGVGNIYANDALFHAKIHPLRPANQITAEEAKELFVAIEAVLQKGIDVGGASEWHYVDAVGHAGKYQNFFLVYRKHGKPCSRCGTSIQKITIGGRGTFFCPKCQQ